MHAAVKTIKNVTGLSYTTILSSCPGKPFNWAGIRGTGCPPHSFEGISNFSSPFLSISTGIAFFLNQTHSAVLVMILLLTKATRMEMARLNRRFPFPFHLSFPFAPVTITKTNTQESPSRTPAHKYLTPPLSEISIPIPSPRFPKSRKSSIQPLPKKTKSPLFLPPSHLTTPSPQHKPRKTEPTDGPRIHRHHNRHPRQRPGHRPGNPTRQSGRDRDFRRGCHLPLYFVPESVWWGVEETEGAAGSVG